MFDYKNLRSLNFCSIIMSPIIFHCYNTYMYYKYSLTLERKKKLILNLGNILVA